MHFNIALSAADDPGHLPPHSRKTKGTLPTGRVPFRFTRALISPKPAADTLSMALYNWKPRYSVKVRSCDAEHIKLFALINELHEAMQSGKGSQVIQEVVGDLERYTQTHFSAEEALMAKTKFPALAAHRMEHQKFVETVAKFRKQGVTGQSIAVLTFLNDWLINHIMRTDQQYSAHLNSNGIS